MKALLDTYGLKEIGVPSIKRGVPWRLRSASSCDAQDRLRFTYSDNIDVGQPPDLFEACAAWDGGTNAVAKLPAVRSPGAGIGPGVYF